MVGPFTHALRRLSRSRPARAGAVLSAAALLAAGCGGTPGSSGGAKAAPENATTDISDVEPMTLSVWTFETSRLELLKEAGRRFTAAHPNVKVKVVMRDFGAYPSQVKLALSSAKPPDVVQGNLGWSLDGPLMEAGLIIDPAKYNEAYGWSERFPDEGRRILEFTPDGKTYGTGTLVGIPYTADVIGYFYNKEKLADLGLEVPRTIDELEAALDKAKQAGETPLMMGNLDGTMALHTFFNLSDQMADPDLVRGIVYGDEGASLSDQAMVEAASIVQDWAKMGYLPDGANGLLGDDAVGKFAKGDGVFLSTGSWWASQLGGEMKENVGFFLPPPTEEGGPARATGSFGAAYEIAAKGKNPDVAAAFLDFLSSEEIARLVAEAGDLPSFPLEQAPEPRYGVDGEIQKAFAEVLETDGLIPYLDATTPTIGANVLYPGMQDLVAGKTDAAQLMAKADDDRTKFVSAK
jgi:raffinose/stachyose/melibiose transport system substrate-binding protein